ncbi:MAG: hypothetical protein M3O74_27835 [Pseudomonadota bacterium]|uniref:hypothetical protein n=1 Tax=Burkholderia sp. PAMC 26561 TaxID=1795043 RepID=UPI0013C43A9B|nr:hypothetical protein [Burkholderia sp. PAMC 26561]MDP9158048.1 hypothetical protein [Pseudomonadota bacterium]
MCLRPVRHFWFMGGHASRTDQWGSQALPKRWLSKQAELLAAWQMRVTPAET